MLNNPDEGIRILKEMTNIQHMFTVNFPGKATDTPPSSPMSHTTVCFQRLHIQVGEKRVWRKYKMKNIKPYIFDK